MTNLIKNKSCMGLAAFAISVTLSYLPAKALATGRCYNLFSTPKNAVVELSEPIRQWLAWETSPTIVGWAQERSQSPLPVSKINGNTVTVEILSHDDIKGLEKVLDNSGQMPWFKHPYNQDAKNVPNQNLPVLGYGIAYHTASRTIETVIGKRLVALKMATDHPFGPTKAHQPGKVKLDADLKYSVARSKAIARIDAQIGFDPKVVVQKEIAAVIDKATGNGYLFRDMSALEDGNYYLPAHQLPYIGKMMAEARGETMGEYWQQHWAKVIGSYQAKLLIRYGMQVRAVNPQNFLIQLNKNKEPTGVLVWRDLAESHLVKPIAEALGLKDFVDRDTANGGWGVIDSLVLDNQNLGWNFNSVTQTLPAEAMTGWRKAHDQAYREEIKNALNISIPENQSIDNFLNLNIQKGSHSEVIHKIIEWHQNHQQIPKAG